MLKGTASCCTFELYFNIVDYYDSSRDYIYVP